MSAMKISKYAKLKEKLHLKQVSSSKSSKGEAKPVHVKRRVQINQPSSSRSLKQSEASHVHVKRRVQGNFNRSSPMKLTKLYKSMSKDQKDFIKEAGFPGLMQIKCSKLQPGLCKFLMESFDPASCALVFPGRGIVPVGEREVQLVLGVPMGAQEVRYALDADAISFMKDQFRITGKKQPSVASLETLLSNMETTDDNYLRFWVVLAICSVLAPTTGINVSPRCYPSLIDINSKKANELNFCRLVMKVLCSTAKSKGKKNIFRACMLFIMIKYVDSLEVDDLQVCQSGPRVAAWSNEMVRRVMEADKFADGSFGELQLKKQFRESEHDLFGGPSNVDMFIRLNTPADSTTEQLARYKEAVQVACTEFQGVMQRFVRTISGKDEEVTINTSRSSLKRSRRRSKKANPGPGLASQKHAVPADSSDEDNENTSDEDYQCEGSKQVSDDVSLENEDPDVLGNECYKEQSDGDFVEARKLPKRQGTRKIDVSKQEHHDNLVRKCRSRSPMNVRKCRSRSPMNVEICTDQAEKEQGIGLDNQVINAATDLKCTEDESTESDEPVDGASMVLAQLCKNYQTCSDNSSESNGPPIQNVKHEVNVQSKEYVPVPETLPENNIISEATVLKGALTAGIQGQASRLAENQCTKAPVKLKDEPINESSSTKRKSVSFVDDLENEDAKRVRYECNSVKKAEHKDFGLSANRPRLRSILKQVNVPNSSTPSPVHNIGQELAKQGTFLAFPHTEMSTVDRTLLPQSKDSSPESFGGMQGTMDYTPKNTMLNTVDSADDFGSVAKVLDFDSSRSLERERAFAAAPDAPSFDLNLDDDDNADVTVDSKPLNPAPPGLLTDSDVDKYYDNFTPEDYEELVAQAGEKYFRSEQRGTTSIEEQCENTSNQEGGNTSKQEKGGNTSGCQQEDIMEIIDDDEIVKSTTPIPQLNQRRPVKPAKSQRSPYVDVDHKKSFTVSKTVNDVYNKACRYGWKSRTALKFERILDYDDNFLIMADLADSVKPRSELVNKTAEIAIYILGQENTNPKKLIMPLRMSTYLIDCRFELKEVTKKFACAPGNRLDHKELIMFPVLQFLTPDEVEKNGHYFVFNLNISAQCFEVMDSLRGEHDAMMMDACQFLAASIKYMWNKNYQHSKIQIAEWPIIYIPCPKQDNRFDCGFFALKIIETRERRKAWCFQQSDMPNIRKLWTYKMLSWHENKIQWQQKLEV